MSARAFVGVRINGDVVALLPKHPQPPQQQASIA
jgi:hypothetical protein